MTLGAVVALCAGALLPCTMTAEQVAHTRVRTPCRTPQREGHAGYQSASQRGRGCPASAEKAAAEIRAAPGTPAPPAVRKTLRTAAAAQARRDKEHAQTCATGVRLGLSTPTACAGGVAWEASAGPAGVSTGWQEASLWPGLSAPRPGCRPHRPAGGLLREVRSDGHLHEGERVQQERSRECGCRCRIQRSPSTMLEGSRGGPHTVLRYAQAVYCEGLPCFLSVMP